MRIAIEDLPDDVDALKATISQLDSERARLDSERARLEAERARLEAEHGNLAARNDYLEHKIAQLLERRAASDATGVEVDGQLLLSFVDELADEAGEQLDAAIDGADGDEASDEPAPSPSDKGGDKRKKRRGGRKKLPDDLPRIPSKYELDEDERTCSCGTPMPRIGWVTSEELAVVEMMFVHEMQRAKYACNRCEDGVLVAPGPLRVLPKSAAGPSLLAWVVASKYGEHLPYYRLEGILERKGARISRATMCKWAAGCSQLLEPIADQVLREILASGYVQTDDTSKRIQRGKEGSSRFGHVWVYTTPDGKVYYDFTETRERHGPLAVLGEFEGYAQADAYSGYDELFRGGKAIEVGCWAHAKRKFDDAKATDTQRAGKALAAIKKLYDIERDVARDGLGPEQIRTVRAERAPPILEPLRTWLEAERHRVLPKSKIGEAIGYVLNQWDALNRYVEDGRLEIDNNRAERMLRSVAVGRKNDLFVFTEQTGQKATVLMSLVESCKAIGVDPHVYLNDVLQTARSEPETPPALLTPWAWKRRNDQAEMRERRRREVVQALTDAARAVVRG